jgi:hypothetical protein
MLQKQFLDFLALIGPFTAISIGLREEKGTGLKSKRHTNRDALMLVEKEFLVFVCRPYIGLHYLTKIDKEELAILRSRNTIQSLMYV